MTTPYRTAAPPNNKLSKPKSKFWCYVVGHTMPTIKLNQWSFTSPAKFSCFDKFLEAGFGAQHCSRCGFKLDLNKILSEKELKSLKAKWYVHLYAGSPTQTQDTELLNPNRTWSVNILD